MITLQPTSQTTALINKIGNADIVKDAKYKTLEQASILFTSESKQKSPRGTGNLSRNIKYEVERDGSQAKVYNKLDYALYQEEGTGIYGKYKRAIVPNRAKFLRFKSKTGKIVFAKSVRGVKAVWFMRQGSEFLTRNWNKIRETLYNELVKGLT